jgi:hypothetical protein
MAQFGAIYVSFDDGSTEKVERLAETIKQKGFLFTVRYHHAKPWIQLYVEEPGVSGIGANIIPQRS